MQKTIIDLSKVNPAGNTTYSAPLPTPDLLPLIAIPFNGEYQLVPGQDKKLQSLKELGILAHPCLLIDRETSMDTVAFLGDVLTALFD